MKAQAGTLKAAPHGVLLVDKPAGLTSHDVVDRLRRLLGVRRIGHTGTLDPQGRGLMVLCIGGATRFASYLTGQDKTYRAVLRLGERTTTDDGEGEVIFKWEGDLGALVSAGCLSAALDSFVVVIRQQPPDFSSKKVAGVPAYRLARRGIKPELKPVNVRIDSLRLLRLSLPELELEINCSSGTYVRALARDLGEKLGCGGHLRDLVRTRVGGFTLALARTLEELEGAGAQMIERSFFLPVEEGLLDLPAVRLSDAGMEKIYNGRTLVLGEGDELRLEGNLSAGPHVVRMLSGDRRFLGLGLLYLLSSASGTLAPKRLMTEAFSQK